MVPFPLTLIHNEIGVERVVGTATELATFLATQNPYLWGGWREYAEDPEVAAAMTAAGVAPLDS